MTWKNNKLHSKHVYNFCFCSNAKKTQIIFNIYFCFVLDAVAFSYLTNRVFHKMLYQAPSPQRKKEPPPREKLRFFLKRSSEPLLNLQNAAQQVTRSLRSIPSIRSHTSSSSIMIINFFNLVKFTPYLRRYIHTFLIFHVIAVQFMNIFNRRNLVNFERYSIGDQNDCPNFNCVFLKISLLKHFMMFLYKNTPNSFKFPGNL